MTRKNLGRAMLAALPFVLALFIDLTLYATIKDRLPDRLAVHFDAGGTANGYLSFTAYLLCAVPAPLLLLALVMATFCRPHVTVDRRGLAVSGLLPRPRVRVPLEQMAGADSRRVNALAEYGGWGYRIRPDRSGVITRSGEAIVISLTSGREFAVTVDDSATGAALLNTLLDRQRAGG